MAAQFLIATQAVTLVANTAKTVIEIPTGANQEYTVVAIEIGSAATAAGSLAVEWGTFTTTGTGTTITPQKWGQNQNVTAALGTVKIADTVEPAGFAVGTLWSLTVPLPGMYSAFYPQGREFYQGPSVNRAIRVNSTQASPVRINLVIEQ